MGTRLFPHMQSDFGKWKGSKPKRGERETNYGRWRRGSNVQLLGIEELEDRLRFILENTEDLRGPWQDIYHPAVLQGSSDFWQREGDNKWRDLTDRYLYYKAKSGVGTRTLVGTPPRLNYPRIPGTLRDSITKKGHPLHIFDMSARWLRTGTRDQLANIHFAKKGRRKRKAIDAKAFSMQAAFKQAVEQHARVYGEMWGG
jgi:hypothetical protein